MAVMIRGGSQGSQGWRGYHRRGTHPSTFCVDFLGVVWRAHLQLRGAGICAQSMCTEYAYGVMCTEYVYGLSLERRSIFYVYLDVGHNPSRGVTLTWGTSVYVAFKKAILVR